MLFDDLGDIFRLDLSIPNALGINENGDTDRAKADGTTICQNNLAHRISALRFLSLPQTFFLQYALELSLDLRAADLRTRFAVADENVAPDGCLHDRCQLFQLVVVVDE